MEVSAEGNPTVLHLLKMAKRHFDGNTLRIEVFGELAEEILQAHDVLRSMKKAMKVLRTRLYELEHQKYLDEISRKRKTMVSTGDRSAKIRTYNYPQSRVTDHRINLTLYNLPVVLDGDVQPLIDALQLAENAERLKEAI